MAMISNKYCLACGSENLKLLFDLGKQPLANSYPSKIDEEELTYPLAVNVCVECFHVQLTHTVDPQVIYKHYLYTTGTSNTMKNYSDMFAKFVFEYKNNSVKSVLDIGCNDGTQLDSFKKLGIKTQGIDPAQNLYPISSQKHDIICDFFDEPAIKNISTHDVIVAQNVFAHNPDPYKFLMLCKKIMDDETLLFIQTSQADMVLNNEFDTIYHEHVNFFNTLSMKKLTERANLNLIDVCKSEVHGTSYIFVISKKNKDPYRIKNILKEESNKHLYTIETYTNWVKSVTKNVNDLKKEIVTLKEYGYKIIGYGAAAKGNTLLNFMGTSLDMIIDDNPFKQGLYTPGTKTPIVSADAINNLQQNEKIVFIPLAWNFFNEIEQKIKSRRKNDTDVFIKYFPKVELYV